MTAFAPSASALTTSLPRRTPPSSSTSIWSPTAPATAGRARIVAGVPSRLLPPWLDTEIAVTPASTARLASSPLVTPLRRNDPKQGSALPRRQGRAHPLPVRAQERGRLPALAGQVRNGQVLKTADHAVVA